MQHFRTLPSWLIFLITIVFTPTLPAQVLGLPTRGLQSVHGINRTGQEIQVANIPLDQDISDRIRKIAQATGWVPDLTVNCQDGIVTLSGTVKDKVQSLWLEQMAKDTHGVVAVVNNLNTTSLRMDLSPIRDESEDLFRKAVSAIPYALASLCIASTFVALTYFIMKYGRRAAAKRFSNPMIVRLMGFLTALPILLVGVYLALKVTGLSGIALTIIGGTGVIGLFVGLALKNGLENYFSGLMLSLKGLFDIGDLVELDGRLGYVRELTTSITTLEDPFGRRVFVPNNRVMNGVVINYTCEGLVGTSLTFMLPLAVTAENLSQAVITSLKVKKDDESILNPEIFALSVTPAGTEYAILFSVHSHVSLFKVRSRLIEQIKNAFPEKGVQFIGSGPTLAGRSLV